jgi:hypothetical protein
MKSYKEMQDQYNEVCEQLDKLFGCSYDSKLLSLLESLMTYAEWANGVVEDAKVSGIYDAVMHERDKRELASAKLEIKRLHTLSSVGIAVKYMQDIYKIESETISYYGGAGERRRADSQLNDQVNYFLDTFTKEGTDEHL